MIFVAAALTHRELLHRGIDAIVRQRLNDRESRPAIDAVGKGVAVMPIGQIANLTQAIGAGSKIRHQERALCSFTATGADLKLLIADRGQPGLSDRLNRCMRRLFLRHPRQETD